MKTHKPKMTRITLMLEADACASIEFRECKQCGRMVDHAEDHKPGCTCRETRLRKVDPYKPPPEETTNAAYCKRIAASLGASAKYVRKGAQCWVERMI